MSTSLSDKLTIQGVTPGCCDASSQCEQREVAGGNILHTFALDVHLGSAEHGRLEVTSGEISLVPVANASEG